MKLHRQINEATAYGRGHERMYHELSPKEQKLLGAIKTINDIKSVVVVDEWEDDHLPCVGTKINKIPIGFW